MVPSSERESIFGSRSMTANKLTAAPFPAAIEVHVGADYLLVTNRKRAGEIRTWPNPIAPMIVEKKQTTTSLFLLRSKAQHIRKQTQR